MVDELVRLQVQRRLAEVAETALETSRALAGDVAQIIAVYRDTIRNGGTLFFCGNGGSAADAQHLATEYVVRYMRNRRALPAIALTTDTSILTAAGNDLGFDEIFARQVEALVKPSDLLVIHSTSGNSPNVCRAAEAARAIGARTVAFTSRDGGRLRGLVDYVLRVPTDRTDRAQEIHLALEHLICEAVEEEFLT